MDTIDKELEREFDLMEKKADEFYKKVMLDDPEGRFSAEIQRLKEDL